MRGTSRLLSLAAILLLGLLLAACAPAPPEENRPAGDSAFPPPQSTPPPQTLLVPGEPVDGDLAEGETDRWIFATASGRLATVEIWFRPASASGPEAEIEAALVGPDGLPLAQEVGTVTLPPYIVEQELSQIGSYMLRIQARSGTPGRYTLLVTLSEERLLTQPEIYTGTLSTEEPEEDPGDGSTRGSGFIWPSPRRAISGWYFHDPANPGHKGLDIAAALHDPLFAAAAGTISFTGPSGGYGNLVLIDHADGWQTWYAHLSYIAVEAGDQVEQGDVIGAAGSTGYSTGPHLHFELRHLGTPVDPLVYLR